MASSVGQRPPGRGIFARVNALMSAIPGPLFTTVMDSLFAMGNSRELTLKIKRGEVPPELEAMFDCSGPLPRLLDNQTMFSREQAHRYSLRGAPIAATVFSRTPAPYRLTAEESDSMVEQFSNFDAADDPVVVMDGSRAGPTGAPTHAYPSGRFVLEGYHETTGLVDKASAARLPFPVLPRLEMDPPTDTVHRTVPKYLAYVGNSVLIGADSLAPLSRTVRSLWTHGGERSVPLRVSVYHAHPSGRYFTMSDAPGESARLAALDCVGAPRGYAEFIASTLLPRDHDVGPDGVPHAKPVRDKMREHWATMFPRSTWLTEPPDKPDLYEYGNTRELRLVADLVAQGKSFEYRNTLDGTPDGAGGGWYLLDDKWRLPEDVKHDSLIR
nr:hypothetical protein [Cladosporium cladosporioides polymycovirus 2]